MAKQIKLTLGNNTKRNTIIVDGDQTPKQILGANGIDYGKAQLNLDGSTLTREELNKPLNQLIGDADSAMLFAVVKTDNAL